MSAPWEREEVSSYAAKVDRGGSGVAVSGHPFYVVSGREEKAFKGHVSPLLALKIEK